MKRAEGFSAVIGTLRRLARAGIILFGLVWLIGSVIAAIERWHRRAAYPSGPLAIRPEQTREAATSLLALDRVDRSHLAIEFAPTVATSVEPLLHGRRYFPRMIEDFEAAQDHIHILIYGYKPGQIGQRMFDVLAAKVLDGVSVRLEVDAIGSEINLGSGDLYRAFRAAGIETVANHALPLDRVLPPVVGGDRGRVGDLFHFDHRKMMVIDGRVGYVGGSGIEDHFNDERFYDVMCRMTGPVVAQLQLVFLASWRYHGGAHPGDEALDACFPPGALDLPPDALGQTSATVLWNVPATGHHPISEALTQALAKARERIEIVNPYITDREVLDLLEAAAERGVPVRIIVPGKPTPRLPAAALRHHYPRLIEAGAEILHHPEMAHAKVATIDDQVIIGGCNIDQRSLYRNDELSILFEGEAVASQVDREVFDELADMSSVASPSAGMGERLFNAAVDRLSPLL